MREVDARGCPCPHPVLLTKKAADAGEKEFTVLVDSEDSAENVRQFAESAGYQVRLDGRGSDFRLEMTRAAAAPLSGETESGRPVERPGLLSDKVLYLTSDSLGRGSDELGGILVRVLLNTLSENDVLPGKIVLVNGGVRLACGQSETVEALKTLQERGVDVMACGTCLKYFNLVEKLSTGRVSNAFEILNELLKGNIIPWA